MGWKQCLFENTNGKVQQRKHPTGNKILEISLGNHMKLKISHPEINEFRSLQLLLILFKGLGIRYAWSYVKPRLNFTRIARPTAPPQEIRIEVKIQ